MHPASYGTIQIKFKNDYFTKGLYSESEWISIEISFEH